MPCRPSSPSFGHRSRGKVLVLSISSARGAISFDGEIPHRFADRVGGFAEIEIEHPLRVGNHGRAVSTGQILLRKALKPAGRNVTAGLKGVRRHGRRSVKTQDRRRGSYRQSRCRDPSAAASASTRLALPLQRDVIRNSGPPGKDGGRTSRDATMHGSIESEKAARLRAAREEAYATPLKDFHPGAPRLFRDDTLWPWFERLRAEEPVHYCTNAPIEPYWSRDQVQRHHACRHQSRHLFSSDQTLGGISIRDAPAGYDWPSFIAMDEPRHSAQRKTVSPMFTPDASRRAGGADPAAHQQGARRPAAQRDLQLRRTRLDRTDHADAGDAVRLPVRGAPQADALVRRRDRAAEERRRGIRGAAPRRDERMRDLLHQAVERARQFRAAERSALDDGASRRHPAHGSTTICSATSSC